MTRALTVVAAVALVATLLAVPLAASETRHVVDEDRHLGSEDAAIEFQQTGETSVDYTAPDLTLTAAAEADQCDITGTEIFGIEVGGPSDVRNDYLCLEYGEDVERTITFYVTAGVWNPYDRPDVEPVKGDTHATYESVSVDGDRYLKVTTTVDEPTTVAWPITKEATLIAGRLDEQEQRVRNITGVGSAESGRWQYVEPAAFENGSAYVIQAPNGTDDILLQYRTNNSSSDDAWQEVPTRERDAAPVYYNDGTGQVQVIVTDQSTPEVRYMENPTTGDRLSTAWREISEVPDRLGDLFGGLFGQVGVAYGA